MAVQHSPSFSLTLKRSEMPDSQGAPGQILLVEDSPGDVSLTREALKSARVTNELNFEGGREAALRCLRNVRVFTPMKLELRRGASQ
jgi:hypothetical protein